ncbi:MAG: hypothetical protein ACOC5S_05155 [Acidobacteriota bacterium]
MKIDGSLIFTNKRKIKLSVAARKRILIAGGIGITPFIRLSRAFSNTYSQDEIVLFFGNKKTEEIVYKKELEADLLKNGVPDAQIHHEMFSC